MSAERGCPVLLAVSVLAALFPPDTAQAASIALTGFQAEMSSSVDPITGNETLSLLVSSSRYGPGGFAGGLAAINGGAVEDSIWLVDPPLGTLPGDGVTAIGFEINPGGEVMGVAPEPFHVSLGTHALGGGTTLVGRLDFDLVAGHRGSLVLSGVRVVGESGTVHDVEEFTLMAVPVPVPAAMWLGLAVLGGLAVVRRVRRRRAA